MNNRELLKEVLYLIESWQRGAYADEYFEIDGVIDAINAELANLTPNIEDASQDWAKLDGAVAWHLIERHAENWGDIGKMMDEYVAAKLAKPKQDWDLLAKTQESLREHMSKVKELEAELATQTALNKKADNARELGLDYEPEQTPVAWMMPEYGDVLPASQADGTGLYSIPLYAAPQEPPKSAPILPFAQFISKDGDWQLQILHKDIPEGVTNLYLKD